MSKAVRQYLSRYAEPEIATCALLRPCARAVVIPSFAEGRGITAVLSHGLQPETLVIVVINTPIEADASTSQNNAESLESLRGLSSSWAEADLACVGQAPFGQLLVIKRFGPRALPGHQGVGLARKIGADIALSAFAAGLVDDPFIRSTDADVVLPSDYLDPRPIDAAALIYPFQHDSPDDPQHAAAARAYDFGLRYYVAGLRYAGSPYAFHTVGSTLAVHAHAYAQVRGFPKINAAEDFYLLNKVAKVGPVVSLSGAPLHLSARLSSRTPFGTGRGIARLLGEASPRFYHPLSFSYLRAALMALNHAAEAKCDFEAAIARVGHTATGVDTRLLAEVINELGVSHALSQASRASPNAGVRERFITHFFDAFKTLKFIHMLRDNALGTVEWQQAKLPQPA